MKILLVAATQSELGPLFKHFNLPDASFVQSDIFDVLITGVGMTATAYALGKHLSGLYGLVLNLGIAGSFDRNLPLGALVNVVEDTFAELGAEDGDQFLRIKELGFGKGTFYAGIKIRMDLPDVKGITVNKVHGNEQSIKRIQQIFPAQTESMEGAAVFYACAQENLPCMQVRSISNYVEKRNRENWEIGLAIKSLNDWAIAFLHGEGAAPRK